MNLTIDARLINSSGIGVYIQNILKSSRLKNYQLRLLYKDAEIDFFNELTSFAEMVPFNAALYSIGELVKTPQKTRHSDVFWSPHFNVPIMNFAKKLKVVTIHDVFHLAHFDTLSKMQQVYAKVMYQRAVQSSDIIFTVSESSKNEIIRYTNAREEKIKVVYNGIDFAKFNTPINTDARAMVLQQYGIEFPFILFVGNVKPHKNLYHALLGFKSYLSKYKGDSDHLRFVIVGKREGFITGDTSIGSLVLDPVLKDRVHFTGWVLHEHLPALYQVANAFVFPSFYEGFGFPPLEAMAAGCPVISSNSSCMPEIYGDAAYFFAPDNIEQIGNAIHSILTDSSLRNALIQKGIRQALKYNWKYSIDAKLDWIEKSL